MKFPRYLCALVFPERCPFCNNLIEPCQVACPSCLETLLHKHIPIQSGAKGFRCVSSFTYKDGVRRLILQIKYYNRTQYISQVAEILTNDIKEVYGSKAFDIITTVPMFKDDYLKREYNQSELLAKEIGKLLSIPYMDTLCKIKRTKKQHRLKYKERQTNLNGAFRLIDKEQLKEKSILIIDDVVTSGNTFGVCCNELNKAKPELICCATVASAQGKYPKSSVI